MEASPNSKAVLRKQFQELRRAFTSHETRSAESQLKDNLKRFLRDFDGVQVGLYQAKGFEAPCALAPVENFFYPRLRGDELEFRRPRTAGDFRLNSFKINEPVEEHSTLLDPKLPTLICCPAVALDSQGVRLGMGRGFYDRYFAGHPEVLRVGVVFHVQISAHPLPAESWDQALDWIVSEKMILRTSTSTRSSQSWI